MTESLNHCSLRWDCYFDTYEDRQLFGPNPTCVRDSDHYKQEYIEAFVDKWDELIDWKRRKKGEGSFFTDILKKHGAKTILDVATGTGYHSVSLLEAGFEVTSADGSSNMLARAVKNCNERGLDMNPVNSDWRYLSQNIKSRYDAVICLGNSFTHLFSECERRMVLSEYRAMLNTGGLLIIDQRNYDCILDNGFSSKHIYYYCGKGITAEPEYVDNGLARFKYTFSDNNEYYLNMFPLRKNYMRELMLEAGFQKIQTFGDFKETYDDGDCDFFIHLAVKKG